MKTLDLQKPAPDWIRTEDPGRQIELKTATFCQTSKMSDVEEQQDQPIQVQIQPETHHRLSCRMYENNFPEVDDLVVVNVRQIAEVGAYVHLLEYNNIEGMILLSELSRRRIRSIQKLIRVGRNEVVVVLRVDKEKGN